MRVAAGWQSNRVRSGSVLQRAALLTGYRVTGNEQGEALACTLPEEGCNIRPSAHVKFSLFRRRYPSGIPPTAWSDPLACDSLLGLIRCHEHQGGLGIFKAKGKGLV